MVADYKKVGGPLCDIKRCRTRVPEAHEPNRLGVQGRAYAPLGPPQAKILSILVDFERLGAQKLIKQ